ncbi:hypothetical protein [Nocardioides mangrovi]|uniref:Uncharacterized protein n=1 Tax=Nocardioides mangrovi TaxID=2874580 RepID=A0ABS7UJD0_9ACTN|nr:hypothetical protein [Nocardioides mangrovi]
MTLKPLRRQTPLTLVAPPARPTAESFYDDTIAEAWRLALALHDGDVDAASDATVRAYVAVWRAGSVDRTSLLGELVGTSRSPRAGRPTTLVPLPRLPRSVPPPVPA